MHAQLGQKVLHVVADRRVGINPFDTPIYRLGPPAQPDFMGTTLKHLDFNSYPLPGMCIHSGSTWYFQCYYRDPEAGGAGFNLGSGVAAYFVQ
ncbi:MAG: hypothetical protein GY711_33370 [bacterium]|nr:hypothetical protein [bacterium]